MFFTSMVHLTKQSHLPVSVWTDLRIRLPVTVCGQFHTFHSIDNEHVSPQITCGDAVG